MPAWLFDALFFVLEALIDLALGGAVFALRDEFRGDDVDVDEIDDETFDRVAARGVSEALERSVADLGGDLRRFQGLLGRKGREQSAD